MAVTYAPTNWSDLRLKEAIDRANPAPFTNTEIGIGNLFSKWVSGDLDQDLLVRGGQSSQVAIGARGPSAEAGVAFGSAADVALYRALGGSGNVPRLKSGGGFDSLSAGTVASGGAFRATNLASTTAYALVA